MSKKTTKIPTDGSLFARSVGVQPKPGSVAAQAAARLNGTDGRRFAERVGAVPPPPSAAVKRFLESLRSGGRK
jgi:hypothetical protein